ncbi:MAG: hypothetical protein ACI9TB_001770 [Parasphingorhabdus sp.]|jgi:hypothetical protein
MVADRVMTRNRPRSIVWFERAFWTGFAVFLLDEMLALLEGIDALGSFIFVETAVTFLLWYFIAVKPKDWVRWLYIVLTAISVVMLVWFMIQEKSFYVYTVWSVISVIANVIAAGFLMRIDAILWCAKTDSPER